MLRVCGVTYTHTTNYGTCLQAYALQEAIEKTEIGNEKCKYDVLPILKCEGYRPPNLRKGTFKQVLKKRIKKAIENHNRRSFLPFEKEFMHYARIRPLTDFGSLNDEYDAFTCGSDVIWSPDYNLSVDEYYLTFAKKYAFSYAPSFGKTELDPSVLQKVRQNLKHLDAIAVRENSSANIARQCTDKPVSIVVDPVLLLTADEWERVAAHPKNKDKYILYYATGVYPLIEQFSKELHERTGIKVVYSVSNAKSAIKKGLFKVHSPTQWLKLIRDAEYIVTNSYHATLFAVIFKKNFYSLLFSGKSSGLNGRVCDFLQAVGLSDHVFYEMPETIDLGDINYTPVYEKLEKMREYSLDYLHSNLEAAYRQKLELEARK